MDPRLFDHFTPKSVIGEGSNGCVFKGRYKKKPAVLKIILDIPGGLTEFNIGAEVYRAAVPMAIEHYAYYETQGWPEHIPKKLLPMMLADCSGLSAYIGDNHDKQFRFFAYVMEVAMPIKGPIEPTRTSTVIFELLYIFKQLDRIGFQHNDLKLDNLVFKPHEGPVSPTYTPDDNKVLALIDFGFSTTTANPALAPYTATSVYGTVVAIPPEGLLMRAYHSVLDENDFEQAAANKTVAGDMWAIGTILINIYVPIYWNFLDLWSPAVNAFATRIIQNEGLYLDTNRQAQPGIMDLLVWIGWYGFLYYLNESQFPTEPNYNDITDESEILRTRPCKYMAELNQLVIDHAIGYELYSKLFGKWTNPNFIVLLRALCQWYPENRSSQQLSEIMEYDVFSTIKHTPIDSRICVECRQRPATMREERNTKYAYCSNKCAHQSYI